MEDCTHKARETLLAISTLELIITVGAYVSMGASTERTSHIITPTLFGDKITATLVVVEVSNE
jgi:hypothetical protein